MTEQWLLPAAPPQEGEVDPSGVEQGGSGGKVPDAIVGHLRRNLLLRQSSVSDSNTLL